MTRKTKKARARILPTALEIARVKREAAIFEINRFTPKPTPEQQAADRQFQADDRLWNDHLRRLTQLKALMMLLSVTDGGELEAFGADVLTIAADLASQCHADFDGRLVELAAKGSRAELAERIGGAS